VADRWAVEGGYLFTTLFIIYASVAQLPPACPDNEHLDRRPFSNLAPIEIQMDAAEKPDQIIPHLYSVPLKRKKGAKAAATARVAHWISFDLIRSDGRVQKSIFTYQYGVSDGDYWVYALVPCDINKDGRPDLLFYSGDDSSDETVTLLNRGGTFQVSKRKKSHDE
jgi:hypothetical protein